MDQKAKLRELELQTKTAALTQTEQDLANAVVIIQEREAELVQLKTAPALTKPITFALTDNDADNVPSSNTASDAGFGTRFPANPKKGDLFLRVDTLPNKLYKWNGQKWIEVAKSTTDRYAYEEEYIKYITDKIIKGEYDMDDLSKAEQEEVLRRLTHSQKAQL